MAGGIAAKEIHHLVRAIGFMNQPRLGLVGYFKKILKLQQYQLSLINFLIYVPLNKKPDKELPDTLSEKRGIIDSKCLGILNSYLEWHLNNVLTQIKL